MPKTDSPVEGRKTVLAERRHSLALFFDRASRWLDNGLQDELRARGMFSTTRTQSMVMGNLSLGEARPSRLARNVGISPQAMSQVLAGLIGAGLIEMVADSSDKRARIINLTQAGEDYLAVVRRIFAEMEVALEQHFGRPVIDVVRMVVESDWAALKSSPSAKPSTRHLSGPRGVAA